MEIMQALLNSKKVKYVVLEKLVKQLPMNTDELNIFISAESIFKSFYTPQLNEKVNVLRNADKYLISSEFINIMAHYRHFFWSRYRIPTNFFVYYSSKEASYNKSLVPDYRESYYNKRSFSTYEYSNLNKMIYDNMKLAVLLSEYLPNIYIVDTKTLEPSVLPYHIITNNGSIDGLTNLIFTNNKMDYQLANLPDTYIVDLKSDDTRILNKDEIMLELIKGSKVKKSTSLNSEFYSSVLALSGCKHCGVRGIEGLGPLKTVSKLEKLIGLGTISNDEMSSKINLTADKILDNEKHINMAVNNYNALNIANMYKHISPKEKHNLENAIVNKSDNMSLIQINDKYYQEYPLMLIELMEGE